MCWEEFSIDCLHSGSIFRARVCCQLTESAESVEIHWKLVDGGLKLNRFQSSVQSLELETNLDRPGWIYCEAFDGKQ